MVDGRRRENVAQGEYRSLLLLPVVDVYVDVDVVVVVVVFETIFFLSPKNNKKFGRRIQRRER